MRELLGLVWARLQIIASIVGDMEGRIIATLFYFTILVPFGLLSRLLTDPLRLRAPNADSYWVERVPVENDVEAAGQQG